MTAVYVVEKLPDVSGLDLEEVRHYRIVTETTLMVSRERVLQLRMASVDLGLVVYSYQQIVTLFLGVDRGLIGYSY